MVNDQRPIKQIMELLLQLKGFGCLSGASRPEYARGNRPRFPQNWGELRPERVCGKSCPSLRVLDDPSIQVTVFHLFAYVRSLEIVLGILLTSA